LILLHVVENSYGIVDQQGAFPDVHLELRKTKLAEAKRYLAGIQGEFREKNITARTYVEEGLVVSAIINVAKREDVDLIAMASHGRTGLAHVYYGSVATGVLHQIDRPLLLVRTSSEFLRMKV
jgi:nucleotide-binding universal stress UspA family protein